MNWVQQSCSKEKQRGSVLGIAGSVRCQGVWLLILFQSNTLWFDNNNWGSLPGPQYSSAAKIALDSCLPMQRVLCCLPEGLQTVTGAVWLQGPVKGRGASEVYEAHQVGWYRTGLFSYPLIHLSSRDVIGHVNRTLSGMWEGLTNMGTWNPALHANFFWPQSIIFGALTDRSGASAHVVPKYATVVAHSHSTELHNVWSVPHSQARYKHILNCHFSVVFPRYVVRQGMLAVIFHSRACVLGAPSFCVWFMKHEPQTAPAGDYSLWSLAK